MLQRGHLERGGHSPGSKSQHKTQDAYNVQLRCVHPVSLSDLQAAYAAFDLDVPEHVASAAKMAPQPAKPESNGHPLDSTQLKSTQAGLSQRHEAKQGSGALHTSASVGALTGAAAPAYATQMDGPNDTLNSTAAAAATSPDGLSQIVSDAKETVERAADAVVEVQQSSLKRDRLDCKQPVDAGLAKKAKTGQQHLSNSSSSISLSQVVHQAFPLPALLVLVFLVLTATVPVHGCDSSLSSSCNNWNLAHCLGAI